MSEIVVDVTDLSKTYRTGFWRKRVAALSGVSLQISRGEIFGLLGPNGAGKTTLFKLLTGLIRPTSGTGAMMGSPLSSPQARLKLGYLPENPAVYDFLNGQQFLELMASLLGMDRAKSKPQIAQLLERVGLAEKRKLTVRKYSKGMVQRLALAQALLNDPPVVILDEPMSGLDPVGRKLVRDIITSLRAEGKTVIFSSHVLSDAEALCDRVGLMLLGRLQNVDLVTNLVSGSAGPVEIVAARTVALPGELAARIEHITRGGQSVYLAPDEASADAVLGALVREGVRIEQVMRHRPTLEDYFVKRAAELNERGLEGAIAGS